MTPPKVFIADSISQRGIDELTRDGALEVNVQTGLSETDLAAAIPDFAALIVRSQTKVTSKILNAQKNCVSWAGPAWAWTMSMSKQRHAVAWLC
jgi:D-isomer specific 2-hydroxyacid dehydrogenase, catalytic domain.